MIIRNVTQEDLEKALTLVNRLYANNIMFNNFKRLGKNTFRVTLRVKSSKKAGHRRGFRGQRFTGACWHVHGWFFEILLKINPKAIIKALDKEIYVDCETGAIVNNWIDWNIGSLLEPLYYSEACDCSKDGRLFTIEDVEYVMHERDLQKEIERELEIELERELREANKLLGKLEGVCKNEVS